MTGTPISNTIAEVYTLQRYLQSDELKSKGIEYFDAWASTFGQIINGWELDATGVNYKRLYAISLSPRKSIIPLIPDSYQAFDVQGSPALSPYIRPFCGYSCGYLRY